jgi:hypothetical protein
MSEISVERARELAVRELGLAPDVPLQYWRVRRIDRPEASYFLLAFGEPDGVIALATVGILSGMMQSSAKLAGRGPHLTVDAAGAIQRAGAAASSKAELVWRPCDLSRSPFYPFWEVQSKEGRVYVDQSGRVCAHIEKTIA